MMVVRIISALEAKLKACSVWLVLVLSSICLKVSADSNAVATDAFGRITATELLAEYPAFSAEYAAYHPTPTELQQIQKLNGLTLIVLFGSWCHDSEREVSRLLKLLDSSDVQLAALQLQAVNRKKQHPDQLNTRYELQYTPTIIVLEQDQELGRIIEKPSQSLAEDLAAIASKR